MLDYPTFKRLAGELTGVDLSNYKSPQMDRRINSLKQLWKIETYDDFLAVLKTNPKRFQEFVKRLTINVSEFFRNPEHFVEFRTRFLPELLSKKATIRIWSAGCSNGAEPYSVAIIVNELGARERVEIIATDLDREVLNKAQYHPEYNLNEVRSVPADLLDKYFNLHKGVYHLNETIQKMVTFSMHDLLADPFYTNLDLIICRNVVIYFTVDAKNYLYQKIHEALNPGGYFWVGCTEPLLNFRTLGFENPRSFFYKKPEAKLNMSLS
jgi:chemotaxis protein methyltransferase CheR